MTFTDTSTSNHKTELPEFFTRRESAARIRSSTRTLDRYIKSGLVKACKRGPGRNARILISREEQLLLEHKIRSGLI